MNKEVEVTNKGELTSILLNCRNERIINVVRVGGFEDGFLVVVEKGTKHILRIPKEAILYIRNIPVKKVEKKEKESETSGDSKTGKT